MRLPRGARTRPFSEPPPAGLIGPMSTPHHALPSPVPVADPIPLRRVLVSVYDKAGLDQLATALKSARIEVVSTGGRFAPRSLLLPGIRLGSRFRGGPSR